MILESKSQLAKLMATENISVEQRRVSTASFDLISRTLTIPILKDELTPAIYDLFMGHEISHALHTPREGWHDAIVDLKVPRSVVNVVEDARIEKLIKRKYPGLRASFAKAYSELVERDFFQTKGVRLNTLGFLDRINLHFKGGPTMGIVFTPQEEALVREVDDCETFQEVVEVSQKIAKLCKEQKKEEKQKGEQGKPENNPTEEQSDDESGIDSAGDDDDSEGTGESQEDSGEQEEGEETKPSGSDGADGSDDSKSTDGQKDTTKATKPEADNEKKEEPEEEEELRSETDDAFRNHEKELVATDCKDYAYGNVPNMDLGRLIIDYKYIINRLGCEQENSWDDKAPLGYVRNEQDKARFSQFRKSSSKVVDYLVKEFELRKNADQMKRSSTAKTGDLNMNRIWSYQLTDDIFKKVTIVPGGKSHGLVMYIDWSGSMNSYLLPTIRQLLNLVLFCKKVNIPFEVYAFTDGFQYLNETDREKHTKPIPTIEGKDVSCHKLHLLNFLSNKMNSFEFTYMCNALLKIGEVPYSRPSWLSLHCTPLNEAIMSAMHIVPKFQRENKLQVVNTVFLTDGEGHNNECPRKPGQGGYDKVTGRYVHVLDAIRHPKTGHVVKTTGQTSLEFSTACLKLLGLVTGCNVVGFYLVSGRNFKSVIHRYFPDTTKHEEVTAIFKKEKSVVSVSAGYDEYYIMNANVDVDDDSELEVEHTASAKSIAKSFAKFSNAKVNNRIILNRFIKLVS